MARNLDRATLALLCVVAVVLAAMLFPATGFGTNPVPAGSDGGAADHSGTSGDVDTDQTHETSTEKTAETSTAETTAETASTTSAAADPDEDTEQPTTESTTTAAAGGDGDGDTGEGGLLGSLLAVATILFTASLGFLASAVGFGVHHRRRNPSQWDLPSAPHLRLLVYVRRIPQTSLAFVMFTGENAPGILDQLTDGFSKAATGMGSAASAFGYLGAAATRGLLAAPAGLLRGIGGLGRAIGSFSLGLSALTTSIGPGSIFGTSTNPPGADPRSGGRGAPDPEEPGPPEPPSSVREAWSRLQEDVGLGGDDGRTPGEVARLAADRGLPTDAIRSLTTTFREVRYGGRPDDEERATTARRAYRRIRSALERDSS